MEIWLPVPGYEAHYSVSNMGRVRRDAATKGARAGKLLRPMRTPSKRDYVALCVNGGRDPRSVHRLVMQAFAPAARTDLQVNHINGDPTDNRLSNLEWVTASDNIKHDFQVLKARNQAGDNNHSAKISAADAEFIRRVCGQMNLAQSEVAARLQISKSAVSAVMTGRNWSTRN